MRILKSNINKNIVNNSKIILKTLPIFPITVDLLIKYLE